MKSIWQVPTILEEWQEKIEESFFNLGTFQSFSCGTWRIKFFLLDTIAWESWNEEKEELLFVIKAVWTGSMEVVLPASVIVW